MSEKSEKLIYVSSVVLGSFNPAILSPKWFVSIGMLEEGQNVRIEGRIGFGGPQPLKAKTEKFNWTVGNNRFELELNPNFLNEVSFLGEMIKSTFSALHFTPMQALGFNFYFELPQILPAPFGKGNYDFIDKFHLIGRSNRLRFEFEGFDSYLEINDFNKEVRFNYERKTQSVDEIIDFAGTGSKCLDNAKYICSELIT
ncbi:MAG: hypothetical protein IID18_05105 [Nitrospinae bacterium]|nr:hypothetical protein [Nitrospinota bacterium]